MTEINEQSSIMEQGEATKALQRKQTQSTVVEEEEEKLGGCRKLYNALYNFCVKNDFILQILSAILLARAYPPLGAEYLQPHITATWISVMFIFVLAGLGLKTEEFKKAFQRFFFNTSVQVFNFGIVSSLVFGISRGLVLIEVIPQALADGMVICACLPLAINVCLVLTKSSGGDEAAAIFNAAFCNLVGVFLSPVLILAYLGVKGDVELFDVFYKLALVVVLPLFIGQVLQKFSTRVVTFVKDHKHRFKLAQQLALVFIVYTVFCKTFSKEDSKVAVGDIFIMIAIIFCLLVLLMGLSWVYLKTLFPNEPTLRVMGLFGCTHKTVAMGVPLINAIYEKDVNVGLYTLPLLIWHPMQLVLGSYLAPRLSEWVESEKARLAQEEGVVKDEKGATCIDTQDVTVDKLSNSDDNNTGNTVDPKEYEESSEC